MIAANVVPGTLRTQTTQPTKTLCADCPLATQPWQTCLVDFDPSWQRTPRGRLVVVECKGHKAAVQP